MSERAKTRQLVAARTARRLLTGKCLVCGHDEHEPHRCWAEGLIYVDGVVEETECHCDCKKAFPYD